MDGLASVSSMSPTAAADCCLDAESNVSTMTEENAASSSSPSNKRSFLIKSPKKDRKSVEAQMSKRKMQRRLEKSDFSGSDDEESDGESSGSGSEYQPKAIRSSDTTRTGKRERLTRSAMNKKEDKEEDSRSRSKKKSRLNVVMAAYKDIESPYLMTKSCQYMRSKEIYPVPFRSNIVLGDDLDGSLYVYNQIHNASYKFPACALKSVKVKRGPPYSNPIYLGSFLLSTNGSQKWHTGSPSEEYINLL